jgi:outer membrane protein OmpA-like peptidoglycan-associated protein
MYRQIIALTNNIKVYIAILTLVFLNNIGQGQTTQQPTQIGSWELVSGFSMNQNEDYIVLSFRILGKYQLYESSLVNGEWAEPKPIESINKHHGVGFDIDGPTLNFSADVLYFHANFPDSKGGFDIYISERSAEGWGAPINLGSPINSEVNETHPSITPGQDWLYYSRANAVPDLKKPKDTPDCQKIYRSGKNSLGGWANPILLHELINKGCEFGPRISADGKTLVFSSVDQVNPKEGYNIYYTKEILDDSWIEATLISEITSEDSNLNPQIIGNSIYFIRRSFVKRQEVSKIFKAQLTSDALPMKTIVSKGKTVNLSTQVPIDAKLTVFNPTTLKELGEFNSNKQTGIFELPLLDNQNYIVDVRKHGYSFASFMIDLRNEEKILAPSQIQLFEQIELNLSVFDNESFRPLPAEVVVRDLKDNKKSFTGKMIGEGLYNITLPIGEEYTVEAKSSGFDSNQFNFNLTGDIIFSKFERSLSLIPIRKAVEIIIADSETKEGVAAEVLITNLSRDEVMIFSAQDIKDGKITAMLREGDQYEFTVRGAQGYSFFNQVIDLNKEEVSSFKAELVSLKAQTSIRLNNINFGSNSAELSSESFPELNRVVQLIADNPSIVIEIAAHTDNVGSASLNKLLSERRAQSVVNYLLENGVVQERMVAKGYGLSSPMVPNTSDENRAMNRRVEFKIIEIISGH